MSDKLQRIAEIEIDGEKYDLAKNGQFCLVQANDRDIYDNPVAKLVEHHDWSPEQKTLAIDGLLDLLGDALTRLQAQRDSRLGRGENGD